MAKATQKGRLLSIITGLGEDYLLIDNLTVTEGLSQLFTIDVELLFDEEGKSSLEKPTVLDVKSILGQAATISFTQNVITQQDQSSRFFNGIFKSIRFTGRTNYFSTYEATIVPQVWELTQIVQSRIFQQKSVKDILSQVFSGYQIKFELQETYEPRNYCVQYNETDFDFASRLMEEEGISYYFEFSSTAETMIITDNYQSPKDCPDKADLGIHNEVVTGKSLESAVKSWLVDYKLQSGKVTYWDYNFQVPKRKLEAQEISGSEIKVNQDLEVYQYPGGYARKYDGISKSGSEQAGELAKIDKDNRKTVKKRIEALDSEFLVFSGTSDCCTLTAGHRFRLKNHVNGDYNAPYILTTVKHHASQYPPYVASTENREIIVYHNKFTCILHGAGKPQFRPLQKTPKPIIYGSQTAFVVGVSGEEIYTDKYGRVKVQFHWDRYGQDNESSSCWVRIAQSLAGNKWGAMFIPRIGMEVIVNFLEGNPDQPIITGCVYNDATMPPYTLPDEKTKSTLKTNSSKGGGGFNEFRIEDKKGSEQIFLHGEKNLDVRIKNDAKEIIKKDRHLIVEGSQYEKVKTDKHLTVTGNHSEKIDGEFGLKVGMNIQEKAGMKIASDAGTEIHLKAGMKVVIEAGVQLSLKVGGNFIDINPAGVFIKGTMVMINSGGSAGSGGGSSPNPPTAPQEADTANPGDRIAPPQLPPPTTPRSRSQKSAAMKKAANNGVPFVALNSPKPGNKNLEKAITKLGKEAAKTVSKLGEKAEKALTEVGKAVSKAPSEVKSKVKEVESKLKQAVGKVKDTLNDGVSKLKEVAEEGKEALNKVNKEAKDKLKEVEKVFDKGKEELEKVGEKVAEKAEEGKKALKEAQQKAAEVKKEAQEKVTEAKQAVEEKAAEARQAVEEKAAEVEKAFADKKEEFSQGLDNLKDKFNPF